MEVQIIATKDCSHRPQLERLLRGTATEYEVLFAEEHPEMTKKYSTRNSPNLLIDEEVVFRAGPKQSLPSKDELEELLLDHILDGK